MLEECPHCQSRVIPMGDGCCPSCQKNINDPVVVSDPQDVPEEEAGPAGMPKPVAFIFWLNIGSAVVMLGVLLFSIRRGNAWELGTGIATLFLCVLCIIGILQKSKLIYWLGRIGAAVAVFQDLARIAAVCASGAPLLALLWLLHGVLCGAMFIAFSMSESKAYFRIRTSGSS